MDVIRINIALLALLSGSVLFGASKYAPVSTSVYAGLTDEEIKLIQSIPYDADLLSQIDTLSPRMQIYAHEECERVLQHELEMQASRKLLGIFQEEKARQRAEREAGIDPFHAGQSSFQAAELITQKLATTEDETTRRRLIYEKEKQLERATECFKKVAHIDGPFLSEALLMLGHIYRKTGNDHEARQYFFAAAKYNNAEGSFMAAQCLHYGVGGAYNLAQASQYYKHAVKLDPDFPEAASSRILSRLVRVQDPHAYNHTLVSDSEEIYRMIEEVIKEEKVSPINGNKLLAEAHFANGSLLLMGVPLIEEEQEEKLVKLKESSREKLKTMKKADVSYLAEIKTLKLKAQALQDPITKAYQAVLKEFEKAQSIMPDIRYQFAIARLLEQQYIPAKKQSQMRPEQQASFLKAINIYEEIIKKCIEKKQPDNHFLLQARIHFSRLAKLSDVDTKILIIKKFIVGTKNLKNRCINLAHCYEAGLLSADGAPDYKNAIQQMEVAMASELNIERLRKEHIFFRYAANPAAITDKLELNFIGAFKLYAQQIYKKNILNLTPHERLEIYSQIHFTRDGLRFDTNGTDGLPETVRATSHKIMVDSHARSRAAASSSSSSSAMLSIPKRKSIKSRRRR